MLLIIGSELVLVGLESVTGGAPLPTEGLELGRSALELGLELRSWVAKELELGLLSGREGGHR